MQSPSISEAGDGRTHFQFSLVRKAGFQVSLMEQSLSLALMNFSHLGNIPTADKQHGKSMRYISCFSRSREWIIIVYKESLIRRKKENTPRPVPDKLR